MGFGSPGGWSLLAVWDVPQGGDAPPDLDLRFELVQPARIRLTPSGEEIQLSSRGRCRSLEAIHSVSRLRWPDGAGRLAVDVKGRWDRPELVLSSRLRSLDLRDWSPFSPAGCHGAAGGGGDLAIRWTPDRFRCRGSCRSES